MLKASTLRPGLLVSLKTSIRGNVSYSTRDIEAEHITAEGEKKAVWETARLITDADEHERATKARSKARATVTGVCAASAFGLLCPEENQRKLDEAVTEAQRIAEDFNSTATLSQVSVYVVVGRIAQDDVQAVRAINSEMRDLMEAMQEGLKTLDVESVRTAANKARALGAMLTPDAQSKVKEAIELARASARKIVSAGEQVASEIDRATIARIAACRTAFLDVGDETEVQAPAAPTPRAMDMEPEPEAEATSEQEPATVQATPLFQFSMLDI